MHCVTYACPQSMWLLTTPAMVYLLGLISDMTQQEVGHRYTHTHTTQL